MSNQDRTRETSSLETERLWSALRSTHSPPGKESNAVSMLREFASRSPSGSKFQRVSIGFRIAVVSNWVWSMKPLRAKGEIKIVGTRSPGLLAVDDRWWYVVPAAATLERATGSSPPATVRACPALLEWTVLEPTTTFPLASSNRRSC